jgi:hypothetical protein
MGVTLGVTRHTENHRVNANAGFGAVFESGPGTIRLFKSVHNRPLNPLNSRFAGFFMGKIEKGAV